VKLPVGFIAAMIVAVLIARRVLTAQVPQPGIKARAR
jgi:hypothetical protein